MERRQFTRWAGSAAAACLTSRHVSGVTHRYKYGVTTRANSEPPYDLRENP